MMADPTSMTFAAAVRAALEHMIGDGAVLLGDTVGMPGSPTEGLPATALPAGDRGAAGVALGMAMTGIPVILELPDASRLAAIADLLAEAGRLVGGDFAPTWIVRVPYGQVPGIDAPLGRVLAPMPGVCVVCPSDAGQAMGLLLHAAKRQGPTIVLEARALAARRGPVLTKAVEPALRELRAGTHVTIAAWGEGVASALDAAEQLAADGIDAQVVDLVTLSPVDTVALGALVQRTGRLVVAHPADDVLAASVRAAGLGAAFLYLESPMATVPAASSESIARAARDAVFY
jgi:pyruvate/2-oxoglutarate/acetoin dehydrogenase E1 component